MKEIEISENDIKLGSFLKLSGVVSTGGEAKLLITGRKVMVNEKTCESRGRKVKPNDVVEVNRQKFMVSSK